MLTDFLGWSKSNLNFCIFWTSQKLQWKQEHKTYSNMSKVIVAKAIVGASVFQSFSISSIVQSCKTQQGTILIDDPELFFVWFHESVSRKGQSILGSHPNIISVNEILLLFNGKKTSIIWPNRQYFFVFVGLTEIKGRKSQSIHWMYSTGCQQSICCSLTSQ